MSFRSLKRNSLAYRLMARGATRPSPSRTNCTSRFWLILSRKERSARSYGVYDEKDGTCERALFVIDRDGVIRWSYVSPIGVNPGANGILSALEDLQTKSETTDAAK